ncbi:hypothetical protein MKW98_008663 [Papaver atlanticum]|uniref:Uncharacterized protein n=1 Tax=Papaver atlanticum TaxID=357466 RepID=A0AAD4S502_9MAGN|nr:hypothetical protein MKW98_008663 [Papaver atlanticum]
MRIFSLVFNNSLSHQNKFFTREEKRSLSRIGASIYQSLTHLSSFYLSGLRFVFTDLGDFNYSRLCNLLYLLPTIVGLNLRRSISISSAGVC